MDGVYHTYLPDPFQRLPHPGLCRLALPLVNAGEGIDVDIFFDRQPKDKVQQKLGQQLQNQPLQIKDTSDTNSDYDDLDSAIRSGYFLKDGLANNEDFYYMNILITVTADSLEELEWRTNEMKKLLLSPGHGGCNLSFSGRAGDAVCTASGISGEKAVRPFQTERTDYQRCKLLSLHIF